MIEIKWYKWTEYNMIVKQKGDKNMKSTRHVATRYDDSDY